MISPCSSLRKFPKIDTHFWRFLDARRKAHHSHVSQLPITGFGVKKYRTPDTPQCDKTGTPDALTTSHPQTSIHHPDRRDWPPTTRNADQFESNEEERAQFGRGRACDCESSGCKNHPAIARHRSRMSCLRSLEERHANCLRRRAVSSKNHARRRAAGRSGRPGRSSICRPGRKIVRPGAGGSRH